MELTRQGESQYPPTRFKSHACTADLYVPQTYTCHRLVCPTGLIPATDFYMSQSRLHEPPLSSVFAHPAEQTPEIPGNDTKHPICSYRRTRFTPISASTFSAADFLKNDPILKTDPILKGKG